MIEHTFTLNHTDIEDSILLVNAGLSLDTADMMIQCIDGKEPKYMFGFYKKDIEYYPDFYRPCWTADRLRGIIDDLGIRTVGSLRDDDMLVPTIIAGLTMKECRANMEDPQQLSLFEDK